MSTAKKRTLKKKLIITSAVIVVVIIAGFVLTAINRVAIDKMQENQREQFNKNNALLEETQAMEEYLDNCTNDTASDKEKLRRYCVCTWEDVVDANGLQAMYAEYEYYNSTGGYTDGFKAVAANCVRKVNPAEL